MLLILTLGYCMTFLLESFLRYHALYIFSSSTVVFSIPNVPPFQIMSNYITVGLLLELGWSRLIWICLLRRSSLLPLFPFTWKKFHPLFWNPITIIVIIFNKVYPDSFSLIIIITIALSGFTFFVAPVPACSSF